MSNEFFVLASNAGNYPIYSFSIVSAVKTISAYSESKNDEIENLANLPAGWDFGSGDVISESVIEKAKRVHSIANLLQLKTEVLPQSSGGVVLNFYKSSSSLDFVEVIINADLSIDYAWERGKGVDYSVVDEAENITLSGLQSKLESLSSSEWNSSEQLISENTRLSNRGLVVIASQITTAGYPFSKRSVRSEKVDRYASTY